MKITNWCHAHPLHHLLWLYRFSSPRATQQPDCVFHNWRISGCPTELNNAKLWINMRNSAQMSQKTIVNIKVPSTPLFILYQSNRCILISVLFHSRVFPLLQRSAVYVIERINCVKRTTLNRRKHKSMNCHHSLHFPRRILIINQQKVNCRLWGLNSGNGWRRTKV